MDVNLVVTVRDGRATLRGAVQTAAQKRAVLEIARGLLGSRAIVDEIDILPGEPGPDLRIATRAEAGEAEPEVLDRFVTDSIVATEEAQPFFPPTDPVVEPGDHGLEIRGGFSATSMDVLSDEGPPEPSDELTPRGDEAIADDVRRELREDAMTAALRVNVAVQNGVVTLRGYIPNIEDAEAAEEVASRIPGVVEVRDHMLVAGV
jgi:osmotically-inducible protein OsmY